MQDMESLRLEVLQKMQAELTSEQLGKLERVLDLCFYEYDITKKSRELTIHESPNEVMLKNFLGCKVLSGISKATIKTYNYILRAMLDDIGKPATEITTQDIRYHLAKWQMERGVSLTQLNNMRNVYSSFFKWLESEELIKSDPIKRIPKFKQEKADVKPFTEQELQKLYAACMSVRDRALLEFMYSTGARVSEISAMDLNDIDLRSGEAIIRHGKGNKRRTVYISEVALYWLIEYLNTRTDNNPAVWIGKQGRLTRSGIESLVRHLGKRAGVEHAHPHRFRHTLATNLIKRNAPVQVVQEILGHERIDTTLIYAELAEDESKNTHKKLIA